MPVEVRSSTRGELVAPVLLFIVATLLKWWPLLLVGLVVPGIVSFLLGHSPTVPYEATVRLALNRERTSAQFESRVKTLTSDMPSGASLSPSGQPDKHVASLAQLVSAPEVERDVVEQLGDQLTPEERAVGALSGAVSGAPDPKSDFLLIKVRNSSSERARLVANAWAESYAKLVNRIYAGNGPTLASFAQGTAEARDRYIGAEQALTVFTTTTTLQQDIRAASDIEKILSAEADARVDTLTKLASADMVPRVDMLAKELGADAANRALAFRKEQDAKTRIVTAYLDAIAEGKLAVVNNEIGSRQQQLIDLYARDRQVWNLLQLAQALRDQLKFGSGPGSAIALMLLNAQAFSPSQAISQTQSIQLQIGGDLLNQRRDDQLAGVEALIQALTQERANIAASIQSTSKELLDASGYPDVGSNMIPGAASALIKRDYQSLSEVGEMSNLSKLIGQDSPLSEEAKNQALSLLQSPTLQVLLQAQTGNGELDQTRIKLEDQLRTLYGKIAAELARQKQLTLERDTAWVAYSSLSNKVVESQVEALSQQQEVQIISPAWMGTVPQQQRSPLVNIGLASLLGLIVAATIAFGFELVPVARSWVARSAEAEIV